MLFDIEKQAEGRWYIDTHEVCPGCPFHGQEGNEGSFCIMRQNPQGCARAIISRRFEKIKFTRRESKGMSWHVPHEQTSLC